MDEFDVRLVDNTFGDIRQVATEGKRLAKWLWPNKSDLFAFVEEDLVPAVEKIGEHVAKKKGSLHKDFVGIIPWIKGSAGLARDKAMSFRDSAGVEGVWAATLFALSSLVVGLFVLWGGG